MTRVYSIKDAAEHLEKLSAVLAREGEAPVAAVVRRGKPVLAVLPWDLYVGLLHALANLPEDAASPQSEGVRALLADATETIALAPHAESSGAAPHQRSSHRRRPGR